MSVLKFVDNTSPYCDKTFSRPSYAKHHIENEISSRQRTTVNMAQDTTSSSNVDDDMSGATTSMDFIMENFANLPSDHSSEEESDLEENVEEKGDATEKLAETLVIDDSDDESDANHQSMNKSDDEDVDMMREYINIISPIQHAMDENVDTGVQDDFNTGNFFNQSILPAIHQSVEEETKEWRLTYPFNNILAFILIAFFDGSSINLSEENIKMIYFVIKIIIDVVKKNSQLELPAVDYLLNYTDKKKRRIPKSVF